MRSLCLLIVLSAFTSVHAQIKPPAESAMDRFLRYVKIDTQSAEDQNTVPSTKKQFDLARPARERTERPRRAERPRQRVRHRLRHGSGQSARTIRKVPTIGFIAHMDTSPAVSGANVNADHP